MIPTLIKTAFSTVTGNARLWLEYALIGLMIGMAGFGLSLWLKNAKVEADLLDVTGRLSAAELTTQFNRVTIDNLKELRLADAQAMDSVLSDLLQLAKVDADVRRKLKELEASNELVKDYMANPIPLELRCLLEHTCASPNYSTGP